MINSRNRFKGHKSLNFVYRNGQMIRSSMFGFKYAYNKKRSDWRLAVVVNKKVEPSAVKRNRIRRRVYEVIRKNIPEGFSNVDMVVTIYDAKIAVLDSHKLEKNLTEVLTTIDSK